MSDLSIERKLSKSIFHSMTGKYLVYLVQLLSMMILARVFSPELFGVFAAVQVFAVLFTLISEMGFGPALVNEREISNEMRDGIFSFTWILGFIISFLFICMSPLISWFYGDYSYQFIIIPIAISIIFNTAIIVPLSLFLREKKFITLARYEAIAEVLSVIIILVLLKFVEPIWALSSKPLTVSFIKFILFMLGSIKTESGTPSFGKEIGHVKKILTFSKYQGGFNFLNFFSRNLDNILVGKFLGTVSLGIYDKAYQLMRYPLLLLTFAMSPAIQPVMKELKNNINEFERLHNKFTTYMSFIGCAVGFFVCYFAEYIVLILLGNQWGEVTILLKVLSISIPIQIVMSSSGGFYQAADRTDLLLRCGIFSFFINVIAISFGVYSADLVVLCWLIVLAFLISFIQCYWVMYMKLLQSSYTHYFRLMINTFTSSGLIFLYLIFFE